MNKNWGLHLNSDAWSQIFLYFLSTSLRIFFRLSCLWIGLILVLTHYILIIDVPIFFLILSFSWLFFLQSDHYQPDIYPQVNGDMAACSQDQWFKGNETYFIYFMRINVYQIIILPNNKIIYTFFISNAAWDQPLGYPCKCTWRAY